MQEDSSCLAEKWEYHSIIPLWIYSYLEYFIWVCALIAEANVKILRIIQRVVNRENRMIRNITCIEGLVEECCLA